MSGMIQNFLSRLCKQNLQPFPMFLQQLSFYFMFPATMLYILLQIDCSDCIRSSGYDKLVLVMILERTICTKCVPAINWSGQKSMTFWSIVREIVFHFGPNKRLESSSTFNTYNFLPFDQEKFRNDENSSELFSESCCLLSS